MQGKGSRVRGTHKHKIADGTESHHNERLRESIVVIS